MSQLGTTGKRLAQFIVLNWKLTTGDWDDCVPNGFWVFLHGKQGFAKPMIKCHMLFVSV